MMTTNEQFLIYDGDCDFCTTCARWIERQWAHAPRPVSVPFQRVHVEWPALVTPSEDKLRESVWWIEGERHDAGARAVARALIATSSAWRFARHALLIPPVSWVATPTYRVIASHRHRLPGATPACRIATSASDKP